MNKKIRQGVFETNSSSTHSICIATEPTLEIPKELHFEFGEFGWRKSTLDSISDKASYLYTGLMITYRTEDFENIAELLSNKGIRVSAQEAKSENMYDNGYIDHSNELGDFLDAVCSDEQQLMNFLFSPLSFILTGNDNDDHDVDINVNYPHTSYYKGN